MQVQLDRGIAGAVIAGGVDLISVRLRSRAATALEVRAHIAGASERVVVPAGGKRVIEFWRPAPRRGTELPSVEIAVVIPGADLVRKNAPAVRLVRAPVVLLGASIESADGLEFSSRIVATARRMPRAWPAYVDVAAVVLGRGVVLEADLDRALRRAARAGVPICRQGSPTRCLRAPRPAVPRLSRDSWSSPAMAHIGSVAAALSVLLLLLATQWRRRGIRLLCVLAVVGAAALPLAWLAPVTIDVRGQRIDAGEQFVYASAVINAPGGGGVPQLGGGHWWVRRDPRDVGAAQTADFTPLWSTQWPGPGRWRIFGFAETAPPWAESLAVATDDAVVLP